MSRKAIAISVALALTAAALWVSRYPIAARIGVAVQSSKFKSNFDPKNSLVTSIHPVDWAIYFNGRFGLSAVRRLSADHSITASGRQTAAEIVSVIENRGHLPALDIILGEAEWEELSFKRKIQWVVRYRDRLK